MVLLCMHIVAFTQNVKNDSINQVKKFQNFSIGASYQMYAFYHFYKNEDVFKSIKSPLPDLEFDFSLDPKMPFRTYKLDSNNVLYLASEREQRKRIARADWKRASLDFSLNLIEFKRFSLNSTFGLLYGKANVIQDWIFVNSFDTFSFNYGEFSSSQSLDIFTSLKTIGYSISLGIDYRFNSRWSLGLNPLINHSFVFSSQSYLMEYEGISNHLDRGVCGFFCDPVDEYLPIRKQKLREDANIYPIQRDFSKPIFDAHLFLKPKFAITPKLNIYFQTGFYLGGWHHGIKLYNPILRPHVLFFGVDYLLLDEI